MEIFAEGEFAGGVGGGHEADGAEDGAFGAPGTVEAAEAPEDAGVGVGVAVVEGVFVVEVKHDF